MFKHIFLNRIKYYVRNKEMVFWLLAFPLILSTMFNFSLKNIMNSEKMDVINVAVVESDSSNMEIYKQVFDSDDFDAQYTDREEAEELLENEEISGYVYFDEEGKARLVVGTTGISQTVLKQVLDHISQKTEMIQNVYETNKGQLSEEMLAAISETKSYVEEIKVSESAPDVAVTFFYTVLAMAAMYGALVGVREIQDIQANQSNLAVRINMAPVSKMKMFLPNILSAYLLESIIIAVLLCYIRYVLGVDFGDRNAYILITTIVGAITGVSIGAFIGAVVKKSEGVKTGIVIGFSMFCSFLAGMMSNTVKISVQKSAPIVDRLNPCNLITEAYYKLYYYDNLEPYWENILILLGMTLVCVITTIIVLRRQQYDSI